jgi:hypothetical protein
MSGPAARVSAGLRVSIQDSPGGREALTLATAGDLEIGHGKSVWRWPLPA